MREDIAKAWVKDLRENADKQGKGCLFDGTGYCCLGRLVLLYGAKFVEYEETYTIEGEVENMTLTEKIKDWAEMRTTTGSLHINDYAILELSSLNDKGTPFAALADIIERNWKLL